jgi:hypothetical protein
MHQIISHLKLLTFIFAALLLAFNAPPAQAQHEGHDMRGMDMSGQPKKSKPQKKKPATQAKPQAQNAAPATGKTTDIPATATPAPNTLPAPTTPPSAPAASPESQHATQTLETPAPEPQPATASSPNPAIQTTDANAPASDSIPATDRLKPQPANVQDQTGDTDHMKMHGEHTKSGHDHDSMPGMKGMNMPGMDAMEMGTLMVMSDEGMGIRLGASESNVMPMGQMGSGTSWTSASTPQHMLHKVSGDWLYMFHYEAKIGVNSAGGARGVTKFESMNWFMPMAFHKLGRGTIQLRGMLSFEPFTFPQGGSPLLFQTGETYKGQPLIDKQHPHDLFMELSATYTMPVGEHGTWFTYFGYPGEPALGPTAFMHRWSASENPSAPLAHHQQDSTHIAFGVLTSGFTYRKFKLEGSVFNGREPDENRYNFEAHPWNSRSVRLSYAPNKNWSAQWSYGLLRRPEALETGDQRRMTASVSYNKPFTRGNLATSLIWGRNHLYNGDADANLNGYTAESTLNFHDRNYLYTRLELVDKNELLRDTDRALLGIADHHPVFRIGAYTFGYAHDILNAEKFSVALGSDFTLYSMPSILNPIYGDSPVSYRFFMRIRPSAMETK